MSLRPNQYLVNEEIDGTPPDGHPTFRPPGPPPPLPPLPPLPSGPPSLQPPSILTRTSQQEFESRSPELEYADGDVTVTAATPGLPVRPSHHFCISVHTLTGNF